jgi:hypothetical protein
MCESLDAWRRWRTWILVANSGSEATVRTCSGNVLRFRAETDARAPANYRTTSLDTYSHVIPALQVEAAVVLDSVLNE